MNATDKLERQSYTLVVVDDDEIVLDSLKTLLSSKLIYNVITFVSAIEAFHYIENNKVDLVISDHHMAEMDGMTFLSKVKQLKPDVPRIILTGYSSKMNAIKAINEIGVFQYIEKPWNNDDLLIVIRNGLDKRKLTKQLDEKIKEINKVYAELQNLHMEIIKTFV